MPSWKITLSTNKADAENAALADAFGEAEDAPVLVAQETEDETLWLLSAYFPAPPSAAHIALLHRLAPSAKGAHTQEELGDEDWLTLSQQGLEPVSTAQFYIHTPHYPPHPEKRNFIIDAGLAFGTGQHATTLGCILALEALAAQGHMFRNILDLGTGTGVLAFVAHALWPQARLTATDIDPIAIEVSRENATLNAIPQGEGEGALMLFAADGMAEDRLARRAPYDLIIANILAQPLIELAPDILAALAPQGRLVLSGLLSTQIADVSAAYVQHDHEDKSNLRLASTTHKEWAVLAG
jgi:ribosomal protein L11 methyltransferase